MRLILLENPTAAKPAGVLRLTEFQRNVVFAFANGHRLTGAGFPPTISIFVRSNYEFDRKTTRACGAGLSPLADIEMMVRAGGRERSETN